MVKCVGLICFILLLLAGCGVSDPEGPRSLPSASAQSRGVDSLLLDSAIAVLGAVAGSDSMNQVVVLRNGYIIHEGPDVDSVHNVWSCTKSFVSTVFGLLCDEGKCDPGTVVKDIVPEILAVDPTYDSMTLHHLATLTSGYKAKATGSPFVADSALHAPGEMFHYGFHSMDFMALVLTMIADESLESYFERKIASKIGMDPDGWYWNDFRTDLTPRTVNGGSGQDGAGVYMCAREMAKFAQLLLQRGRWNGKQLISSEWIDLATANQVPRSLPAYNKRAWYAEDTQLIGAYGYNFWVNDTISFFSWEAGGVTTEIKWPPAPPETFLIQGYNFNTVFIIPTWDMVFIRLGDDHEIDFNLYREFLEKLGRAIDS